jgi:hypothetical protein
MEVFGRSVVFLRAAGWLFQACAELDDNNPFWRKTIMRRMLTLGAALLLLSGPMLVGCDRTEKSTTTEKVSTPGGTTTTTVEKTVKSSGDNPPPNRSGESVPPK